MNIKRLILLLSLVHFFGGCSKSGQEGEATEDPAGVEISDADESGGDTSLDNASLDGEEAVADSSKSGSGDEAMAMDDATKPVDEVAAPTDAAAETNPSDYVADASATSETPAGSAVDTAGGSVASTGTESGSGSSSNVTGDAVYHVQSNETLMLIAFKLYGDYSRWKEIAMMNKDKLNGSTLISPGMDLKYSSAGSGFSWNPPGKQHVVQNGDTLSLISNHYYGTLKKWHLIWDNNKPLIKDPNKIFIGFTLYVPEEGMRDVASIPASPVAETQNTATPAASTDTAQAQQVQQPASGTAPAAGSSEFPEDI